MRQRQVLVLVCPRTCQEAMTGSGLGRWVTRPLRRCRAHLDDCPRSLTLEVVAQRLPGT